MKVNQAISVVILLVALVVPLLPIPAFASTSVTTSAQSVDASITSLVLNPTTNRIYVTSGASIRVIDGASNGLVATILLSGLLAVNPDTNRIYVAHADTGGGSSVSVVDGSSNTVVTTTKLTTGPAIDPYAVTVNPATNRIYVLHGCPSQGCDNPLMFVVDGATNTVVASLPVDRRAGYIAVNARTNLIYLSNGRVDAIDVVSGASNSPVARIPIPPTFSLPVHVVANPTTNRIHAGGAILNGETGTVLGTIPVDVVAVNPKTNRLYGFPAAGDALAAVDGASNAVLASIPLGLPQPLIAVNPTTNRIYSATPGGASITVIDGASNAVVSTIPAALSLPAPRDVRFFSATGFRISNDAFWDFFNKRGGIRTFGYPVSRAFTFLGFTTQFFQREIMQIGPDGTVRTLNILDGDLMPYTTINGATLPGVDPTVTARAPIPGSPGYGAVLEFVRDYTPNRFEGMNTNYFPTFANTVMLEEAFPGGGGNPDLLPGFALELWGLPTSKPARDPNNGNFVYLRFQRGIMHFDATNNLTQGLLLADYLKGIITGRNLPADLELQARGSRFYKQYNPAKPRWIDRPDELPGTDLTNAFQTE